MLPEHQARGECDDHYGNVVALARAIRAPIENDRRYQNEEGCAERSTRLEKSHPSGPLPFGRIEWSKIWSKTHPGKRLIGSSGTPASTTYGQTLGAQLEQLRAAGGNRIRTGGPTSPKVLSGGQSGCRHENRSP